MEFTPTEYFMDNDLYMILQCVGMGDMDMARDFTKSFCENHSDILPQDLTQWVLPRLDRDLITNIPAEIENLIVYEDVSKTFNINRYYVSKREKKLLKEIINLSKSGDLLSAAKIPFANTTLLIGPPGVGKTEFGRYLAFTMGLPFIRVDLRRIFGAQFGETGRNLQNIFKFVSTSRCLFMLDEIDAIGANRGTISTGGSGDDKFACVLRGLHRSNAVCLGVSQSQLCEGSLGVVIFRSCPGNIAVCIGGHICLGFIGGKEGCPSGICLVGVCACGYIVAFQIQ